MDKPYKRLQSQGHVKWLTVEQQHAHTTHHTAHSTQHTAHSTHTAHAAHAAHAAHTHTQHTRTLLAQRDSSLKFVLQTKRAHPKTRGILA